MNKIEKTYPAPAILTTNGAKKKNEVIAQVESKNLFPLLDETARNIGHRNISNETPLQIDSVSENPGDHICFEGHIIKSQITDGDFICTA